MGQPVGLAARPARPPQCGVRPLWRQSNDDDLGCLLFSIERLTLPTCFPISVVFDDTSAPVFIPRVPLRNVKMLATRSDMKLRSVSIRLTIATLLVVLQVVDKTLPTWSPPNFYSKCFCLSELSIVVNVIINFTISTSDLGYARISSLYPKVMTLI